jgi:uncharacterized protein (DUF433 family)
MSGAPVVTGTRVQAETIVTYLRTRHSRREIFEDYPSLPIGGIDAVIAWAEATFGPDWKGIDEPAVINGKQVVLQTSSIAETRIACNLPQ